LRFNAWLWNNPHSKNIVRKRLIWKTEYILSIYTIALAKFPSNEKPLKKPVWKPFPWRLLRKQTMKWDVLSSFLSLNIYLQQPKNQAAEFPICTNFDLLPYIIHRSDLSSLQRSLQGKAFQDSFFTVLERFSHLRETFITSVAYI
jgi:hypothetical protein